VIGAISLSLLPGGPVGPARLGSREGNRRVKTVALDFNELLPLTVNGL